MNAKEYFDRGLEHLKNGNLREAILDFKSAIALEPYYTAAVLNAAYVLEKQREYEEALEIYNNYIKLDPDKPLVWFHHGFLLEKMGNRTQALESYDTALALKPDYVDVMNNKGTLLAKLGKHDEAIALFTLIIQKESKNAKAYNNRGGSYAEIGKFHDALDDFNKALDIDPEYAMAWSNKGMILGRMKRFDEAILAIDEALKYNSKIADIWLNKGALLGKMDKTKEALECFEKALVININFAKAWYNKGLALKRLKNFIASYDAFKKAIEIDDKYNDAHYYLGELYFLFGSYDQSLNEINKILVSDEKYWAAHLLKGKIYVYLNRTKVAKEELRTAKNIDPLQFESDLWSIYCKYIESLGLENNHQKKQRSEIIAVIRELEKIISIWRKLLKSAKPNDLLSNLYYWLAIMYSNIDDYINAKDNLIRSLDHNNKCSKTREFLNFVWNCKIRPSWWRWWFYCPIYLNRYVKRLVGVTLLFLFGSTLLILSAHPIILSMNALITHLLKLNLQTIFIWQIYAFVIIVLAILILLPILQRLKAGGFEMEIVSVPKMDSIVTPQFLTSSSFEESEIDDDASR